MILKDELKGVRWIKELRKIFVGWEKYGYEDVIFYGKIGEFWVFCSGWNLGCIRMSYVS